MEAGLVGGGAGGDVGSAAAAAAVASTFICKGYLFERLNEDTAGSAPAAGAGPVCGRLSAGRLMGWWAEWPELSARLAGMGEAAIAAGRWAVLTKRHWLALAVGRSVEGEDGSRSLRVDGDEACGIEELPTISTAELVARENDPQFPMPPVNSSTVVSDFSRL